MTKTFLGLLALADLSSTGVPEPSKTLEKDEAKRVEPTPPHLPSDNAFGLHYNIQLHLPATKDVEVYNAIFKSLREHLLEE
jgi:hypothetical protein